MIGLGKKHNSMTIISYGEDLINAANSFNIESILTLIRRFPEIVDLIKQTKILKKDSE